MPTVNPSAFGPCPQIENAAGAPLVGGLLFFYAAGTTTKQTTYTNSTGTVANTNPVVLNSLGQPSTEIWWANGQPYKMVIAPSTDTDPPTNPIRTFDNLRGINDTTTAPTQSEWITDTLTPIYVNATSFTLTGNQTATYQIGRRLKTTNTSGTIYSTITNSVFGALTTITVTNDSGVLDSGLSVVAYGILAPTNPSIPNSSAARLAFGAAALGANTDITSLGNNTSTIYITGGTSTAYTITPNPAIAAYAIGQSFVVNFNAASGASPTLQISGIATPPQLIKENIDGTYSNISANDIPINHRSRVTLISTTQALVETLPSKLISGTAVATTSGTAAGFTGLPAGVKRITMSLAGVSTNGTSPPQIQLGSGSYLSSGYLTTLTSLANTGTVANSNPTTGFVMGDSGNAASSVRNGSFVFTLVGSNVWVCNGSIGHTDALRSYIVQGQITLGGALDRIQLTTVNGTDTFDAGSVNILYE